MAGRHSMPKQGNAFAAGAVIAVLAAWYTGPAIASSNATLLSDDISDVRLEIASKELQAKVVSHEMDANGVEASESDFGIDAISPSHYLTPKVEAALRKVFKDSATPIAGSRKPDSDEPPAMHTRVPGVSDDELARYRHQMYRTDI